jgi:hypothetical protein
MSFFAPPSVAHSDSRMPSMCLLSQLQFTHSHNLLIYLKEQIGPKKLEKFSKNSKKKKSNFHYGNNFLMKILF